MHPFIRKEEGCSEQTSTKLQVVRSTNTNCTAGFTRL